MASIIPEDFLLAAEFWYDPKIAPSEFTEVIEATMGYLDSKDFRTWADCDDDATLAAFDLLCGAAEAGDSK